MATKQLKAPAGCREATIGDVRLVADVNGVVEVPAGVDWTSLLDHGFTEYPVRVPFEHMGKNVLPEAATSEPEPLPHKEPEVVPVKKKAGPRPRTK